MLGGETIERDGACCYILPPNWTQLTFQRVPEVKMVKNRLHLDVLVDDLAAAAGQAQGLDGSSAPHRMPIRVNSR